MNGNELNEYRIIAHGAIHKLLSVKASDEEKIRQVSLLSEYCKGVIEGLQDKQKEEASQYIGKKRLLTE